jgi:CheY-like chemotaxis protein
MRAALVALVLVVGCKSSNPGGGNNPDACAGCSVDAEGIDAPDQAGWTPLISRSWTIPAGATDTYRCTRIQVANEMWITGFRAQSPLGTHHSVLTLYAGATISGSGKVQLILDPAQLVRRAYPNAPTAAIADAASAPMVLAGRALVVDDSRAIREAMTSMLGREGWIVDVAEDGARALQMARQLHYDLVVTDLEMPEVGGFDLIARLRKDERLKATPIVVITSRANPEHRRRARDLGVRALVAKPITRRKLLEALAAR